MNLLELRKFFGEKMLTYIIKYHLTPLRAEKNYTEGYNQPKHWVKNYHNNRLNLTEAGKKFVKYYQKKYFWNSKFIREIEVTKEEVGNRTVRYQPFFSDLYFLLEKKNRLSCVTY